MAQISLLHPHEPEIPPTYDAEGRCLVCVLIVERDRYRDALMLVEMASEQDVSDRYAAISHKALFPETSVDATEFRRIPEAEWDEFSKQVGFPSDPA